MSEAVLVLDEVSKTYRRGRVEMPALRRVRLEIAAGETVALMGPSGSGKTTLLNLVAGLDRPTAGTVTVCGQRVDAMDVEAATTFRRRRLGFVFQFFNLLPGMTAAENVALPLAADRLPRAEVRARSDVMLVRLGVAHLAQRRPEELSGGEQQRVAIARALVMRPTLLLADEPTGNLDSAAGAAVLDVIRHEVATTGLSVLLVTHAPTAAAAMDRTLTLHDGRLVAARDAGAA